MKLYAELPLYRARQMLADGFMVLWIVVWARVGSFLHSLVERLAGPARLTEGAGSDLAAGAGRAGENVAGVPVVGKALKAPFDSLVRVGRLLEEAGRGQQSTVESLALWLGLIVALIPIAFVLYSWLPRRWRWMTEASAAGQIRTESDDLHLFALRAIATRSLSELRKASRDPAADYASGNYSALAALELKELGLRPGRAAV